MHIYFSDLNSETPAETRRKMTGTMRLTLLLVVLSVAVLLHSNYNSLVQAASGFHHYLLLSAYHSVNVLI